MVLLCYGGFGAILGVSASLPNRLIHAAYRGLVRRNSGLLLRLCHIIVVRQLALGGC